MRATTGLLILASAALSTAQVAKNANGTYVCALPSGRYCAAASLKGDTIIRCVDGIGYATSCDTELASRSPVGEKYSPCWQSSTIAGNAACSKDGTIYPDGNNTTPYPIPNYQNVSASIASAATVSTSATSWPYTNLSTITTTSTRTNTHTHTIFTEPTNGAFSNSTATNTTYGLTNGVAAGAAAAAASPSSTILTSIATSVLSSAGAAYTTVYATYYTTVPCSTTGGASITANAEYGGRPATTVFVTDIVTSTVITCPAGQAVTLGSSTTTLTASTVLTATYTARRTVTIDRVAAAASAATVSPVFAFTMTSSVPAIVAAATPPYSFSNATVWSNGTNTLATVASTGAASSASGGAVRGPWIYTGAASTISAGDVTLLVAVVGVVITLVL